MVGFPRRFMRRKLSLAGGVRIFVDELMVGREATVGGR
jgi:hypothetical protein